MVMGAGLPLCILYQALTSVVIILFFESFNTASICK